MIRNKYIFISTLENTNKKKMSHKDLKLKVHEIVNKYKDERTFNLKLHEGLEIKKSKDHKIILNFLEVTLKSKYPEVKVHAFGSRLTGIGTENSDLDVFVDLGENY